jgi:hypothetical protein
MGNKLLISEDETIHERLADIYIDKILCIWTWRDTSGNLYDASGSKRKLIYQYAQVHDAHQPIMTKFACNVTQLGKVIFTNVRKSTITRTYDATCNVEHDTHTIEANIIVGDHQGKSYNITQIYIDAMFADDS